MQIEWNTFEKVEWRDTFWFGKKNEEIVSNSVKSNIFKGKERERGERVQTKTMSKVSNSLLNCIKYCKTVQIVGICFFYVFYYADLVIVLAKLKVNQNCYQGQWNQLYIFLLSFFSFFPLFSFFFIFSDTNPEEKWL